MRGMVLALALLLAVLLARQPPPQPPALRAAMLLCLGLAVQVPSSSPWVEHELGCTWQTPLIALSVGNGVLFWLLTAAMFDDAFRWRAWHLGAWALAALVGGAQCTAVVELGPGPLLWALRAALRGVTLLCVLGAMWVALRQWRADLVESRRRLRLLLVAGGIVYTAVQLGARLSTTTGLLTPGLALLDMALLLAVLGAWALAVLRLADLDLLANTRRPGLATHTPFEDPGAGAVPAAPASATTAAEDTHAPAVAGSAPGAADPALATALQRAMAEERAYRTDALTVSMLAERLGVPEYRLRRHINQQLGFRNFNAYVNSFRLADARRWLSDPLQGQAPILTIALDAGFGSIGPFNRAFKADTGLTPSEFRARALTANSNA